MVDLVAPQRTEKVTDKEDVPNLRFARYLEDNANATNQAAADIATLQALVTALEARVTTLEGFH